MKYSPRKKQADRRGDTADHAGIVAFGFAFKDCCHRHPPYSFASRWLPQGVSAGARRFPACRSGCLGQLQEHILQAHRSRRSDSAPGSPPWPAPARAHRAGQCPPSLTAVKLTSPPFSAVTRRSVRPGTVAAAASTASRLALGGGGDGALGGQLAGQFLGRALGHQFAMGNDEQHGRRRSAPRLKYGWTK